MCEGVIGAARDWSETSVMRVGGPFSPQSMKVSGLLHNDWVNTSKSSFNTNAEKILLSTPHSLLSQAGQCVCPDTEGCLQA